MEANQMTLNDFAGVIKRRKWSLILPAAIIFLSVAIVTLALPPIYKSSAKILVEEQEIPYDYVKATVTSFVEQRLQAINQSIMSSSRLLEIINQYCLIADRCPGRTNFELEKFIPCQIGV